MKYARLTFLTSDSLHKKGEKVNVGGDRKLLVGQGPSCDLELPGNPGFEDEMYFMLLRMKSGDGWCIVVHRSSVRIAVDGIPVLFASAVQNGSHISIGKTELVFTEVESENGIKPDDIIVEIAAIKRRQRINRIVAVLIILFVAGIAINLFILHDKDYTQEEIDLCKAATYKVCVDRIYLEEKTSDNVWTIRDSTTLANNSFGSAVLVKNSKDSLFLLTARHCVQPWLTLEQGPEFMEQLDKKPYSWAVISENSIHSISGPEYRMTAYCSVKDNNGSTVHTFYSSDCIIDTSRDLTVELTGTDDSVRWWRMITPVFYDYSMQLGDFAIIRNLQQKFDSRNALPIDTIPAKRESCKLRLWGFTKTNGRVSQQFTDATVSDEAPADAMMSFNADAKPGYSGGPITMKKNGKLSVIGICSKEADDSEEKRYFLAVPSNIISPIAENPDTVIKVRRHKR